MATKGKVRMLRVSEKVWEALMRMKLDSKKESIDDLLADVLKLKEDAPREAKEGKAEEGKKEGKSLASAG